MGYRRLTYVAAVGLLSLLELYYNNPELLKSVSRFAATTYIDIPSTTFEGRGRRKIAIVSGFVAKNLADSRLPDHYMPHLLNKACYAHHHNYTFIFNTTWGYPTENPRDEDIKINNPRLWHLDHGHWQVVPYMEAAFAEDYDWVLWTDADYIFQHMDVAIDQMIDEWESATGSDNVHVLVSPGISDTESDPKFPFQSWAVLMRNSPFGRRVLHHWRQFALGLCQNGNFKLRQPSWRSSDQPGLWYALTKSHMEHFDNTAKLLDFSSSLCNNKTGYLRDSNFFAKPMQTYFRHVFQNRSHSMANLHDFPSDQPILWSSSKTDSSNETNRINTHDYVSNNTHDVQVVRGFGIDVEPYVGYWRYKPGITPIAAFPNAFGLHVKRALAPNILHDLETCRTERHCVAGYFKESGGRSSDEEALVAKCGNQTNRVDY